MGPELGRRGERRDGVDGRRATQKKSFQVIQEVCIQGRAVLHTRDTQALLSETIEVLAKFCTAEN